MPRSDTYPGALDRRASGSWRWRVSIAGERVTETWSGDLSEAEAARNARKRYDVLAAHVARGDDAAVRLSRLIACYREERLPALAPATRRAYDITFRAIETYFGDRDPVLTSIQRGNVKGFVSWRRVHGPEGQKREEPLSGWSLQRELGALSSLFSEAIEREWIEASPTGRVSVDTPGFQPVLLSEAEYEMLLEEAAGRPMLRIFLLLAGEAGLRKSEALDLRWTDLDLSAGFLEVVQRPGRTHDEGQAVSVGADDFAAPLRAPGACRPILTPDVRGSAETLALCPPPDSTAGARQAGGPLPADERQRGHGGREGPPALRMALPDAPGGSLKGIHRRWYGRPWATRHWRPPSSTSTSCVPTSRGWWARRTTARSSPAWSAEGVSDASLCPETCPVGYC